ncbi:MAG: TaqI-like C-terminal specificity domain-containing protein [Bacillota bacterium]
MVLDEAMLLMARALERAGSAGDLTLPVRASLLEVIEGAKTPPWLREEEGAALRAWTLHLRASEGDRAAELYQQMLRREIIRTEDGPRVRVERGHHRRTGAYYTTDAVVRYMVSRARALCPGAESLIDPACGAGAFLQAAGEEFGGGLTRLTGWDLDPLAIALCRARYPGAEFRVQDALLAEEQGGYDLCLGNPPYISSGLRGAVVHHPERLRALRQRYPQSAQYKLNTYPLFIERGLELLHPGGVLGFIVPDSFLTGRYFAGLRHLLLRHTLLELTLIQQDFWAHGRVGQSVILFVRKAPAEPGHQVRLRICADPSELPTGRAMEVPLHDLTWGHLARFRLVSDTADLNLLRQMERSPYRLGDWLHSYSGLIARRGQASLLLPAEGAPEPSGPVGRLLRSGREIDRYWLNWNGARVRLDPALIKSGGNRAYYERPKLLLRQTADSLRAVYDDQGYYCLNNIHLLVPARGDTNLRALLGLINASVVGRYYRAVAMEAGRLYPQVDLDLLESLPFPDLPAASAAALESLVIERESAAPEEAAQVDRRIDALVESLYGLR